MSAIPQASLPIQFHRLNPWDLQSNESFATLADAQAYANGPTAVIGQIIRIVTADPVEPIQYLSIEKNKTLKVFGSGGSGSLEEEIVAMVDAGGIKKGDTVPLGTLMTEVWKRQLNPDVHPAISSFTSTPPAFGLQEVGQSIAAVTLTGTVVKGTNNIKSAKIIRLPNTVLTDNISIPNGGTVTITDSVGINNGTRDYRLFVEDVNGLSATMDLGYEFVFPAYTGSCATKTPTEPQIKALAKHIVHKQNVSYAYTYANEYPCGVFPDSWGTPLAIRDQNGFLLTSAFTKLPITLTHGSYLQLYNIYMFDTISALTDFTFNFIFEEI